jgi:hypothetical protein
LFVFKGILITQLLMLYLALLVLCQVTITWLGVTGGNCCIHVANINPQSVSEVSFAVLYCLE